jgi:LacI family transcriptional regulator
MNMKHVAILIETSRAYGRGLLRGIARFHGQSQDWMTYFEPHGLGEALRAWFETWRGDGVLARIDDRRTARILESLKIPVINLRGTPSGTTFPFVGSNNLIVAQVGAKHLIDCGFERLAFVGYQSGLHRGFSARSEAFFDAASLAGKHCTTFTVPPLNERKLNWMSSQQKLLRWLKKLDKPIGIMTANDDLGLRVLEACRQGQIRVPDEVAVLGVDNDEYLCNLAIPPLSSISINSEETGFYAAKLLDALMRGRKVPSQLPQIAPGEVVARRSTDIIAIDDEEVAKALRFIRENACRPINVTDVLLHFAISRSSLSSRFRQKIGKSVHECIQQVRIDTAKRLLTITDMPIKLVSKASGFRSVQYMSRVFLLVTNETPAEYRRKYLSKSRTS